MSQKAVSDILVEFPELGKLLKSTQTLATYAEEFPELGKANKSVQTLATQAGVGQV